MRAERKARDRDNEEERGREEQGKNEKKRQS